MDSYECLRKIQTAVDEHDLVSTRIYIEENLEWLKDNRHLLKGNARELFDFILARNDKGEQPLTRPEIMAVNAINAYAKKFDLRGLKLSIKNHAALLLKDEIRQYLNTDAKIILEGMGAIEKSQN
ncbi:hypothetical protein [Falsibacillus pallidus]|uniref:Uncharacterized protein n=1 Tax=Falsibacillus pallidus TaxID=493781 RepID=A0A370G8N8_9BACI|nr:hypothetical protein [Falsibacillus pallidus]RDI40152.1 hypothetical protein DFR59_11268 [Falsibacillus pallidus]